MNLKYSTFRFLIRGRKNWLTVVAISLDAARADVAEAFFDAEVIQVSCNFS